MSDIKLGIIETTEFLVTVKREDVIADGIWDNRREEWLVSATDRESGDEIERSTMETKRDATLWCLEQAGFDAIDN